MLLKLVVAGLAVLVRVLRDDNVGHLYFFPLRPIVVSPQQDQPEPGYLGAAEQLPAKIPERLLRESEHSVIQRRCFFSEGDFVGLVQEKVVCIAEGILR